MVVIRNHLSCLVSDIGLITSRALEILLGEPTWGLGLGCFLLVNHKSIQEVEDIATKVGPPEVQLHNLVYFTLLHVVKLTMIV